MHLILALPLFTSSLPATSIKSLEKFSGVTFENKTVDYNGTEYSITLSEDVVSSLPEGTMISYTNNVGTNAGIYNASVKLSKDGYEDLVLNAQLTINKLSYDVSQMEWNYDTAFDYNGTEKEVVLTGVPTGVTVSYSGNKATNAGNYTASATFSYDTVNYNEISINNLSWKINKIKMAGLVFDSETFTYDGEEKTISVKGAPEGSTITYTESDKAFVSATEVGNYLITATVSHLNYQTEVLTATLKIRQSVVGFAKNALDELMVMPDPWGFLPESFKIENRAMATARSLDFENSFVSTSNIPTNGIGKQMNVLYNLLSYLEVGIKYIEKVYSVLDSIVDAYQNFINNNPDDFASFEIDKSIFQAKIMLLDDDYQILVKFSTVALEIYYDSSDDSCIGRIQVNDSTAIKYVIEDDYLFVAAEALGVFAGQIEFKVEDSQTFGYLYEYWGTESTNIKTSAVIYVDETYTTIVSNKRDLDDLIIEGYAETYLNSTGEYLMSRVKETVKNIEYDTLWFNLKDVQGINNIKVSPEANLPNPSTIYINNNTEAIHTKLVGGFRLDTASRRFDIEIKDLFFYSYDVEKEKFVENKVSIPMLFVQTEFLNEFTSNFNEKNGVSANIMVSSEIMNYVDAVSPQLISIFETLKTNDLVSYAGIKSNIGTKNSFFS